MTLGPRGGRLWIAVVPLIAAVFAACGESGSTIVSVNGVAVDLTIAVAPDTTGMPAEPPDTLELEVGEVASLVAVATNALGLAVGDADVAWSSSDAAVATVSVDGAVTAIAPGAADVSASVDDVTATLPVAVTAPDAP